MKTVPGPPGDGTDGGGRSDRHRGGHRGDGRGVGELDAPLDRLGQLLVLDRQLEQVDGAGGDDVPEAGVGPPAEGEDDAHLRELLADQPEAGEAGAGAEAGTGDEDVERTLGLEHLPHGAEAGASDHLGRRGELGHAGPELVGQQLAPVEDEDLGGAHRSEPQAAATLGSTARIESPDWPSVGPAGAASPLTRVA